MADSTERNQEYSPSLQLLIDERLQLLKLKNAQLEERNKNTPSLTAQEFKLKQIEDRTEFETLHGETKAIVERLKAILESLS